MISRRRRRTTDIAEVDTEGSWAISYGDMITLLLTFFIMFFSTDRERDRLKAMESSLVAILDSSAKDRPRPPSHPGADPQMDEDIARRLDAKVFKVGQKLIVQFPETSFYDRGAISLTARGSDQLKKFVKLYLPFAGTYVLGVRAYTDSTKVRAHSGLYRYADNLELSALRSVAAMRVLQTSGVPLNRMRLGGYGELRLTADDLARAIASEPAKRGGGLALARKVVLVIEPEPKETL